MVSNLPSTFNASLSYDAHNAYLNLALNFAQAAGLNGNQRNVGNALTNFFNTNGGIPMAFAALSPAGNDTHWRGPETRSVTAPARWTRRTTSWASRACCSTNDRNRHRRASRRRSSC